MKELLFTFLIFFLVGCSSRANKTQNNNWSDYRKQQSDILARNDRSKSNQECDYDQFGSKRVYSRECSSQEKSSPAENIEASLKKIDESRLK